MNKIATLTHLSRRALTSLSNKPPSAESTGLARKVLNESEFVLWSTMQDRDQRHSLEVLRRFDRLAPRASREERAAALLHDVGKTASGLGWTGRIAATLLGARTRRFSLYLDHESIGGEMLHGVSTARTIDLVTGRATDEIAMNIRLADDV